ncbi:hypothetical protein SUNI508_12027 [Seiridium unicorne]|uniref:Uncharacterized protein n=1 Tax=Seiridium unicorne TaxID=138068 RepID=A0ABR2UF26_9PEZI
MPQYAYRENSTSQALQTPTHANSVLVPVASSQGREAMIYESIFASWHLMLFGVVALPVPGNPLPNKASCPTPDLREAHGAADDRQRSHGANPAGGKSGQWPLGPVATLRPGKVR